MEIWTELIQAEMKRLYDTGVTLSQIGDLFGISGDLVDEYVKNKSDRPPFAGSYEVARSSMAQKRVMLSPITVKAIRAKDDGLRFWSKVIIGAADECWEWTASRTPQGYGRFSFEGGGKYAHRAAWILLHGSIPDGMCICHHCDNPACVNLEHLYLGDAKSNRQDCVRRDRAVLPAGEDHWMHQRPDDVPKGSQRGQAKLTESIVREIRHRKQTRTCPVREFISRLAEEYGVCRGTIAKVVWGKTWKHVTCREV